MTQQSVILLTTLFVMAGLALGYWLAWAWGEVQPYLQATVSLVLAVWGMHRLDRDLDSVFLWFWEAGIRAEPYMDTEPTA